jgi:UDP-N-acetylmuramoyl-tripeptide--D-alanyl-D-alanine ligase
MLILLQEALDKASYVIIDNASYYIDERTLLVDDGLITLQNLAKFHREFLNIPIIALTGVTENNNQKLIQVVLSKNSIQKQQLGI